MRVRACVSKRLRLPRSTQPIVAALLATSVCLSIGPASAAAKQKPDGTVMQVPQLDTGPAQSQPLQGHLSEVRVEPALASCTPFGLTCLKVGKTELPARVASVELNSPAFHCGVKEGDVILKANATNTNLDLTIQRDGKTYSAKITLGPDTFRPSNPKLAKAPHPFSPSAIAQQGPEGVLQGRYPNCWFEAALAAVAAIPRGQQVLSEMIIQNPDSSYSVVFRGDNARTFYVRTEAVVSDRLINPTPWANVIEEAERQEFPDNDAADSPSRGSPKIKTGLAILTGHQAQFIRPDSTAAGDLEQLIRGCVTNHIPIIIATKSPGENGHLPQVVVPNHAYAIIGFNPSTKRIILRNPLGDTVERDIANKNAMMIASYGEEYSGAAGRGGAWPLPMVGEERDGVKNLGSGFIEMSVPALQQYARYIAWSQL